MRNFINSVLDTVSTITVILFILIGISWLFDYEPKNLWTMFKYSCNVTAVSFVFYLLFGGKTK